MFPNEKCQKNWFYYCPEQSYGKVMFSLRRGTHVTITHDVLDLIVQGHPQPQPCQPIGHWTSLYRASSPAAAPHPWPPPLDIGHQCTRTSPPLLVTSGGRPLRPIQTCSLENPTPIILTSVGYLNMYDWQAGATHPTGTPFYCKCVQNCRYGTRFKQTNFVICNLFFALNLMFVPKSL